MPVRGGVVILEVGGAVGFPTDDFIPVVEAEVVVVAFACGHSETEKIRVIKSHTAGCKITPFLDLIVYSSVSCLDTI